MTYTPTQLDIIRVFGRKDISNGLQIDISEHRCETCSPSEYCWNKIHHYLSLDKNLLFEVDWYEYTIQSFQEIYSYENPTMSMEILWHIPEIFPDVAMVAEKRNWSVSILAKTDDTYEVWVSGSRKLPDIIKYNPILPLIEQLEATLIELLTIFK